MNARSIVKKAIESELHIQHEFNPTRSGVAQRALDAGLSPEDFEREYQYFLDKGFISEMAGTEFIQQGEVATHQKVSAF